MAAGSPVVAVVIELGAEQFSAAVVALRGRADEHLRFGITELPEQPGPGVAETTHFDADRRITAVIVRIVDDVESILLDLAQAFGGARPLPRRVQRRKQHACQNSNDSYNHKQLY